MKLKDWIISCICTGVVFLLGLVMLITGCCVNVLVAISSIAVFVLAGAGGIISLILYQQEFLKDIYAWVNHDIAIDNKTLWKVEAQEMYDKLEKYLKDLAESVGNLTPTDGTSTPTEPCNCKEHLENIEKMLQDAAFTDIKETLSKLVESENPQENAELITHIDSKVEEVMQQFNECKEHLEYMRDILDKLKKGIFGDDFDFDAGIQINK